MTNHNHSDQLDCRLEQVHRVFMDDHDTLRQDLLDRLDQAPTDLPPGAIPTSTSDTRKWIMRSSIGLAAAIAIAVVISIALFGSGPVSPPLGWAGVRDNVQDATAMHYRQQVLVFDARGKQVQSLGQAEQWIMGDGRTRYLSYDAEDKPGSEVISVPIHGQEPSFTLMLSHTTKHAQLTVTHRHTSAGVPQAGGVDASNAKHPLDMLLLLTERYAERIGEVEIDGVKTVLFRVKMADVIRASKDITGDDEEVKVEQAFGGSEEAMSKLPPVELWVDQEDGLPIRMHMPMAASQHGFDPAAEEGQRSVIRFDFLGWNAEVDEAIFEPKVPEGWALDRSEVTLLGDQKDLTPDDAELVTAGLPLAKGVTFRLLDAEGKLVATEADLSGVTQIERRTGYSKDGDSNQNEWDRRLIKLRFKAESKERIAPLLKELNPSKVWSYRLGEKVSGSTGPLRIHTLSHFTEATQRVELEALDIGELTVEEFIEAYMADQ